MDTNSATLEQDVDSALSEIRGMQDSGRFRCYEIARLLSERLRVLGYEDVRVQTGKVQYNRGFLGNHFLEGFEGLDDTISDALREEARLNPQTGKTPRIFHSWVEVGDMVVDYHNTLDASRNHKCTGVLIVKHRDELNGNARYWTNGGEVNLFGRTFIYTYPLVFTGLRIPTPEPTQ